MSPSRSLMTTFAPCSLRISAVVRPMPRADPVTIATLSSRTPMSSLLVQIQRPGMMPCGSASGGDGEPVDRHAAGLEPHDAIGARGERDVAREDDDADAVLVGGVAQE